MSCNCKKPVFVLFKKLRPDANIPAYQTEGASGFDLAAIEDTYVHPGETMIVKTGLACEITPGYEMQIRPRSGVSLNTPLIMKNAPGTIDCDYRGELGIIMHCLQIDADGNRPHRIKKGDRIAQGVIVPVVRAEIAESMIGLSMTNRGAGGYGSTGSSV